jgi:hypothetical protein
MIPDTRMDTPALVCGFRPDGGPETRCNALILKALAISPYIPARPGRVRAHLGLSFSVTSLSTGMEHRCLQYEGTGKSDQLMPR